MNVYFCREYDDDCGLMVIAKNKGVAKAIFKAEIERLNNNISAMATTLSASARATRHEAYKEFAERLKEKKRKMLDYDEAGFSCQITVVSIEEIDNLLNELVGDGNSAYIDKQN